MNAGSAAILRHRSAMSINVACATGSRTPGLSQETTSRWPRSLRVPIVCRVVGRGRIWRKPVAAGHQAVNRNLGACVVHRGAELARMLTRAAWASIEHELHGRFVHPVAAPGMFLPMGTCIRAAWVLLDGIAVSTEPDDRPGAESHPVTAHPTCCGLGSVRHPGTLLAQARRILTYRHSPVFTFLNY
jgi:hypothetical protein